MTAVTRPLRDQRGFTMAELLVVAAVLGLVLAGVFALQQQGQQAYLMGSNRVETQQNARVALDLLTRELRSAQSITAIPSASDITFVDQNANSVRWVLSGTTINRTDPNGTQGLMGGVQALTMTYFSDWNGQTNTGTTTTNPNQVTTIRARIRTKTEEGVGNYNWGSQQTTMESMIKLRNK